METRKNRNNIALGIFIAAIGALLLLNNFMPEELPFKYYIFSWKTLRIGIGLGLMAFRKNYTAGLIVAGLGVIFWLPALLNYQIALKQVLIPGILIIIGAVMLLKAAGLDNCKHRKRGRFTPYEEVETIETPAQNS